MSAYFCSRCGFQGPNVVVAREGFARGAALIIWLAAGAAGLVWLLCCVGYYWCAAERNQDGAMFCMAAGGAAFLAACAILAMLPLSRRWAWSDAFCSRCNMPLGRVR